MIGFYVFVYLFIGFLIVFSISKSYKTSEDDNSFLVMYVLGTLFWPIIILIKLIAYLYKIVKKFLY